MIVTKQDILEIEENKQKILAIITKLVQENGQLPLIKSGETIVLKSGQAFVGDLPLQSLGAIQLDEIWIEVRDLCLKVLA